MKKGIEYELIYKISVTVVIVAIVIFAVYNLLKRYL